MKLKIMNFNVTYPQYFISMANIKHYPNIVGEETLDVPMDSMDPRVQI